MAETTRQEKDAEADAGTPAALLFTDIEGSTALLQHLGDAYPDVLTRHNDLLRQAILAHDGREVSTKGDSFFAIFDTAETAVAAALQAQKLLQQEAWPDGEAVRVRMGVHAGRAREMQGDYVGLDVHRAARISDAARGGQVILSRAAHDAIEGAAALQDAEVRPLGRHKLKDLRYPETLFDIVRAGLMQDFGPVRSLSNRPTNLSESDEPLFGRDKETDEILTMLRDGSRHVVTIIGPGGIGKSSLAQQVGVAALEDFPDGVHIVELGGLSDASLVFASVAQTIGVRDFPGRPVLTDIAADIGQERRLLILDTFEHLADASAGVGELIDACPNLRVLITSRMTLGLRSEAAYTIEALRLPPENATAATAAESPSVQLFVERVRESDPAFELTDENAPIIARICHRLEGMPLAIELGAARIRMLSPAKLLERLDARLSVLKGGRRSGEDRHRTLREAIAWSDQLLEASDREVFERLSVFVGGFDLMDAEEVLEGRVPSDPDILEAVDSLVGKSLIRRTVRNGEPRFGMYDMIRDYAMESLQKGGEADTLREGHMTFYSNLARDCGALAMSRDMRTHVVRLEAEADNIRASMKWALENGNVDALGQLVYSMHWYWVAQALFTEAFSWVDRALAMLDGAPSTTGAALIHESACTLRMAAGDYMSGKPHGAEALRLYEAVGDRDAMMRVHVTHSICAAVAGEIEDPSEQLQECVGHFMGRNDDYTALALILLGEGARMAGVLDAAEGCYSQALEVLHENRNVFWPGHLWQNIAHFRLKEGDWKAAAELLSDGYDLAEDFDYTMVTNLCVAGFAGVALHAGNPEDAARILGGSAHNLSKIGVEFEPTDKADIESYESAAREALGAEAYDALAAEGAALPWVEIKTLARSKGDI